MKIRRIGWIALLVLTALFWMMIAGDIAYWIAYK